jgi:hypothetical protein
VLIPVLTAALALMQAAPETNVAAPAAAPAAASAATPAKKPEADPLICRDQTPLGSRLPQRVCRRKSEIERAQRVSRSLTEDAQTRSRGPFVSPN